MIVSNHGGRQLDGVPATLEHPARGRRGGRRPLRGADRRRHPPRNRRASSRWRSGRGRCSPGGRRSGASPSAGKRARGACSRSCGRRSSWRWCCSAARRRPRSRLSTSGAPRLDSIREWPNGIHARRRCDASTAPAALFSAAYGNVGSSIYYALGVIAAFALGLTPLAFLIAGRDLRLHRGHLCRGDGDVPGGRRLVELRPPRVQRARQLPRGLGRRCSTTSSRSRSRPSSSPITWRCSGSRWATAPATSSRRSS